MTRQRILMRRGYLPSVFDVEAYSARRRELNLQQWEVAQLANVNPTMLSRLVTGRDLPPETDDLILQVETALDMRPGSLRRKTPPAPAAPVAPAPSALPPPFSPIASFPPPPGPPSLPKAPVATVVPVVPPVYGPPTPPAPPPFDHAAFAAKLLEESKALTRREAEALLDMRLKQHEARQLTHTLVEDMIDKRLRMMMETLHQQIARHDAKIEKTTESNRAIRADLTAQIGKVHDRTERISVELVSALKGVREVTSTLTEQGRRAILIETGLKVVTLLVVKTATIVRQQMLRMDEQKLGKNPITKEQQSFLDDLTDDDMQHEILSEDIMSYLKKKGW